MRKEIETLFSRETFLASRLALFDHRALHTLLVHQDRGLMCFRRFDRGGIAASKRCLNIRGLTGRGSVMAGEKALR
jgi:hypothetical protein